MQHEIASSPDLELLNEPTCCAVASCSAIASMEFAGRTLCLEHFLPACIDEIAARNERLRNLPFDPAATDALKALIANCAQQAEKLAAQLNEPIAAQSLNATQFAPARTKTALLEFLLRISQLNQRIRRGPRTASSVPIWLRREDPHQTWHEETWTVTTSRHGAALLCRRPVEKGGTVVLCRKDKGSRATAQVVYSLRDSEGRKQIGVQFCDHFDFWDPA